MDAHYVTRELESARQQRDAARTALARARKGSRKWLEVEEDLHFWQGKVANLEAAATVFGVR
jgi:hypothetical protein